MKWLQLAYSVISVNAVILALLAVIVNLLGRARSRMTTDAKSNCDTLWRGYRENNAAFGQDGRRSTSASEFARECSDATQG
jgi:hypothetical protein